MINLTTCEWRNFRYLAPAKAWSEMLNLKMPEDKRYRLRVAIDLSPVVRDALYGYRYVQEFVQMIGFVYAIIFSAEDQRYYSRSESESPNFENVWAFSDKYLPTDFDYEALSKELWDDQHPELLCNLDLWTRYKDEKSHVIENFRYMVESYALWRGRKDDVTFDELVSAFYLLLEVK